MRGREIMEGDDVEDVLKLGEQKNRVGRTEGYLTPVRHYGPLFGAPVRWTALCFLYFSGANVKC